MRNAPAEVRATWPAPNYDNPVRRGNALIIVETCMVSLAFLTLLARMYVRLFVVRTCGPDDWIMVVAMIFGIGVTTCVFLSDSQYGWNIHIWDLTSSQAVKGRQVSLAAQTLFLFSSGLAKASILTTYLRIASTNTWFRRLTWCSIVLVVTLILVFLTVLWTQCKPMKAYWLIDGLEHCNAEGPPVLSQAITTIITDVIAVVLPLPTLFTLRLPRHERVVLALLFGCGVVVILAACWRAYWSHYVTDKTYDVTWEGFFLWIWTAVEANLGVICGNVPALRPLLRLYFKNGDFSPHYYTESITMKTGHKPGKGNHVRDSKDVESADAGVYELRRQPSKDSHASSLELNSWSAKEQRLPDHSSGPLTKH